MTVICKEYQGIEVPDNRRMMDMDMSGKTVIVAGLGVSGQSMMEVLGSRAEKCLAWMKRSPMLICTPLIASTGIMLIWL